MPFQLYVHVVGTTLKRAPLIDADLAEFLQRLLRVIAKRRGARVLEIGMVNDHVHLVLQLPRQVDLPRLVQGLKGASARIANRDGVAKPPLRWADGYDVRSVGPDGVARVIAYVRNQARHHPDRAIGA